MNPIYSIIGFWIAFMFFVLGYAMRKKKLGQLFYQIALAATFISSLMFLWWAVIRGVGSIN